MQTLRLTPGARRILVALDRLQQSHTLNAWLLLAALIEAESRAGDWLKRAGIIAHHIVPEDDLHTSLTQHLMALDAINTDDLPFVFLDNYPLELQEILHAAEYWAADGGRGLEVATEHLLLGLMKSGTPQQAWLAEAGFSLEEVQALITKTNLHTSEPLDISLELSAPSVAASEAIDTYRALDASANRAREGLRVVEDFIRFVLNDRYLAELAKNIRHGLADALIYLDERTLIAARDTKRDVGTNIKTSNEAKRGLLSHVAAANIKRVEEAFRSLEEFGKRVHQQLPRKIEELRYEMYTLEKAIFSILTARQRLEHRHLYLVIGEEQSHHGIGPAIREAIKGGVEIVQLREKRKPDRQLLSIAHKVREWTRDAGVLFIMNDRPDLALLAEADGVHIGQTELTVQDARRIVGPDKIVGLSTHSLEQAEQAELDGADYIGVGPVFTSTTKSFGEDEIVGLELLTQVAAHLSIPAFAIGGINIDNLPAVVATGIERVAVSSAICSIHEHQQAAWQLRKLLPG